VRTSRPTQRQSGTMLKVVEIYCFAHIQVSQGNDCTLLAEQRPQFSLRAVVFVFVVVRARRKGLWVYVQLISLRH
jgi:hypothetical protein